MRTCTGTTRKGSRCNARPVAGSDRCQAHPRPTVEADAVEQVAMALRAGNYLEVAARAAGVELEQLLGEAAVVEELETARALGEVRAIARIAQAAAENWQAAAWLLERQYPERWARPANRAEEKPLPPVLGADALDELAGRRASRRARSIRG